MHLNTVILQGQTNKSESLSISWHPFLLSFRGFRQQPENEVGKAVNCIDNAKRCPWKLTVKQITDLCCVGKEAKVACKPRRPRAPAVPGLRAALSRAAQPPQGLPSRAGASGLASRPRPQRLGDITRGRLRILGARHSSSPGLHRQQQDHRQKHPAGCSLRAHSRARDPAPPVARLGVTSAAD